MAIVGGAVLPVVVGALADKIGIHRSFFLPAICYLYIVYYGFGDHDPCMRNDGATNHAALACGS